MEDHNKRVLAYELATQVPLDDLDQVSGGTGIVYKPTTRISGSYQSTDVMFD